MSIQDDIKKTAREIIDRWAASCEQVDSVPSMDLMADQILETILIESIQKAVAQGLETAAKECQDKKHRTPGFVLAYHAACSDLNVILLAMAGRIKKGEYEHPVSSVEDFASPTPLKKE